MNKKPVNGMRDVLPSEMELRSYVLSVIRDTYRSYGFTEMETPVVESIENLQGRQGGENEKLIFKIMKRGEKLKINENSTAADLLNGWTYGNYMTMLVAVWYIFTELGSIIENAGNIIEALQNGDRRPEE